MKIIKFLIPPLVALAAFLYFASPLQVLAANGTLYFNPGEGRFAPGGTFTVEVRADTGSANRPLTRATFTYPKNLLQAIETTSYGSDFGNSSTSINHSIGRVTFTAYDSTPPTGSNKYVYKITFKVLAQGSATLSFANDTAINGALVKKHSATYTLAPATCPPGQIGTPPNCTTPSSPTPTPQNPTPNPGGGGSSPAQARPSNPAPRPGSGGSTQRPSTSLPASPYPPIPLPTVPDTSEPIVATEPVEVPPATEETSFGIGNIRTRTLFDTTTINWESNHPGTSTFYYGTAQDTLDKRIDVKQESPTSFSAAVPTLQPGEKYFYEITATQEGDSSKQDIHKSSFTTKGYPVKITILYNDTPLAEAAVSLKDYSGSTVTGESGSVNLELKEGTYSVVAKKDSVEIEQTISVKSLEFEAGGIPDTQNFTITGSGSALSGGSGVIIGLVIGGLLLVVGFVVAVIVVRKKRAAAAVSGYQSVVIDDWTPPTATTYVNSATGEFNVPPPPSYPQAPVDNDVPENEYFADLDKR